MPPKNISGKRGSNSRQPPWQGGALPTELFPLIKHLKYITARHPVNPFFAPDEDYMQNQKSMTTMAARGAFWAVPKMHISRKRASVPHPCLARVGCSWPADHESRPSHLRANNHRKFACALSGSFTSSGRQGCRAGAYTKAPVTPPGGDIHRRQRNPSCGIRTRRGLCISRIRGYQARPPF